MNIKFTEEFIELVIYFICHFKQQNYGLCLAQLGRTLMLILGSFCTTVYCWCVLSLRDLFCHYLSRKVEKYFDLSPVAFLSSEKLDLYSVKVFLTRREQWEDVGGTRPG